MDSDEDDGFGAVMPTPNRGRPPKHRASNHSGSMVVPTLATVMGASPAHSRTSSGSALMKGKRPSNAGALMITQSTASANSRRGNRVGDSAGTSPISSAAFDEADTESRRESASSRKQQQQQHGGPVQLGRHGAAAMTGGPSSAVGSRRQSKMLKPSQHQQHTAPVTSNSAPASYVASRKWTNAQGMTFGQRVQLAEHPERWADWTLAVSNIVDVWEHYDANDDGELNRSEVTQLASDVVDRFCSLYEEQLAREHPGIAAEDSKRLMRKDVFPHLLPGDSPLEAKRAIFDRLTRELDVDRDGTITRTEFLFQWKNTSKNLLTIQPVVKNQLACAIL